MSDRAARERQVREGLALRNEVLRYLASPTEARSADRLHGATVQAWTLLLRFECCAMPLVARLRADGVFARLATSVQECLAAAEAPELQRVLAARGLVRELDGIAADAGMRLTVLKGAAIAADAARQPLDLGDVDVLVARESADEVWRLLLARGWSPVFSDWSPAESLGARQHFAPLRTERHALALELHARFDYAGAEPLGDFLPVQPIPGYRALDRLSAGAALPATLRHSVVAHPHRRGHLRDLFLLAASLRELNECELSALERQLAVDDCAVELRALVAQARSVALRDGTSDDPPTTRPFVVWKYAVGARTSALLDARLPGWKTSSYVPLERPPVRRAAYRRLVADAFETVPPDSLLRTRRWIGVRLSDRFGVARALRGAYRLALAAFIMVAGPLIRRHLRRLDSARNEVD